MYFWVTAMDLWPAKLAKTLTEIPLLAKFVIKVLLPEWLVAPEMPECL